MDNSIEEKYLKAGKIASEVRERTKRLIVDGESFLKVAEFAEELTRKLGGIPAFPVNLSVNETAAHYTPMKNDDSVFKSNDVVKLDIGVHVDGHIADTAVTICLDEKHISMKNAAEKALKEAIKEIRPGVNAGYLGEIIENTITTEGFKPVSNLTGHVLAPYNLHTKFNVPNIKTETDKVLDENDVVAIEPFVTDGAGMVKESGIAMIYMFMQNKPVRLPAARKILELARDKYKGLPFAKRWLDFPAVILESSLRQLVSIGALHKYPILKESRNGLVAQAEHTIIVREKPIVTTS